jgi:hypothetical protein
VHKVRQRVEPRFDGRQPFPHLEPADDQDNKHACKEKEFHESAP